MKYRREYDLKVIGKNLRYYRKKNNLSVEYVRNYLRLGSNQAIYKWESGGGYPQTDTMFSLMELYGIGLKELLGETKEIHYDRIYVMFINTFIIKEMDLTEKKQRKQQLEKRMKEYYIRNILAKIKTAVV